jgi:hypothetical protein
MPTDVIPHGFDFNSIHWSDWKTQTPGEDDDTDMPARTVWIATRTIDSNSTTHRVLVDSQPESWVVRIDIKDADEDTFTNQQFRQSFPSVTAADLCATGYASYVNKVE